MAAKEKIAGYEPRLREYTNFAVRGVRKVCKECGPRPSCSAGERKAQEMMRTELETCCDEVRMEEFKAAPGAFLLWVRTGVLAGLAGALLYNLGYAIAAAAVLALALLFALLQFILYRQAADFLPRKTSQNLIGVRKPSGEVKRRLILCGHTDTSYERTYTYLGYKHFKKPVLLVPVAASCFAAVLFGLGVSVWSIAAGEGWAGVGGLAGRTPLLALLGYVFAGLCLPLLSGWFFQNKKRPVTGANKNLSGCFTAMAVPKLLGGLKLRLENTEIMVLCGGCGEIGPRGVKAFCKAHAREFGDAETIFIALDTIADLDHMAVRHGGAVCALLQASAKTAGHELPRGRRSFGASDAAAQAGLRACMLAAADPAPADYYRTRLDTAERLQPKTVEACLNILMETAYQFDETGLAPFGGTR